MTPQPTAPFWRWSALALLIAGVPHLLAWLSSPANAVFHGALINMDDLSVYLSAMRQGGEGAWLFRVTFTPEEISPKLTYPFYLLLGRMGGWLGLPHLLTFHAARLASGGLVMACIYVLLRRMQLGAASRDAYLWSLFAGGFGWLFAPFGWRLPDFYGTQWTLFLSLFHTPHFLLGIAAELVIMIALLQASQSQTAKEGAITTIIIAFGALGAGLVYPYRILPIYGFIGLYVLVEVWRTGRVIWRLIIPASVACGLLLPLTAYYALVARADPHWESTHVAQNIIAAPSSLAIALGLGIPGLLAVAALIRIVHDPQPVPTGTRLTLVWIGVSFLFLYVPVSFQGRFALGMFIPVCILASQAIHEIVLPWLEKQDKPGLQRIFPDLTGTARRVLFILTLPTLLMSLGYHLHSVYVLPDLYYIPKDEIDAAEWLADNSTEDATILVYYAMGNYLPRLIQGRVFVGQPYVTVDPLAKLGLVHAFFNPVMTDEWRQEFLTEWQITHIYYGRSEQELGDMPMMPNLTTLYRNDTVVIYGVE